MTSRRRAILLAAAALLGAAAFYFTRSSPQPTAEHQPSTAAAPAPVRPSDAAQKSIDKSLDNFAKTRPPPPPPPSLHDK